MSKFEEFIISLIGDLSARDGLACSANMRRAAAHILKVAEEYVNKGIGSGDFGAKDMVVTMHHQGDSATARMLYDYLKQYIQGEK